MLRLLPAVAFLLLSACEPAGENASIETKDPIAPPGGQVLSAQSLAEQLIAAAPGSVIELPEGNLSLERGLTLSVSGVTLRGQGKDKTVLDFTHQKQGAEGLLVSASDFVIEGLTIRNTKGDALKINQGKNIVVRGVRTEWIGGPKSTNGAYGIYPVQCESVLIEASEAIGASDAGIYIGQSKRIVVRNNHAEFNVAGIEIENSSEADVYGNVVTHNTGGILVFDLPDLPVQGGQGTRVFRNQVVDNNTDNFAPAGNIVGTVPAGTGIMINANDRIEVFDNVISDHQTAAAMIISYLITGRPVTDPNYDPYPEGIFFHNNQIGRSGWAPDSEDLKKVHAALGGADLPAILWDGIVDEQKFEQGQISPTHRVCAKNNGAAQTMILDAANGFKEARVDALAFDCEHPALAPVELSIVELPSAELSVAGL